MKKVDNEKLTASFFLTAAIFVLFFITILNPLFMFYMTMFGTLWFILYKMLEFKKEDED